jgi:4-hydroxy-3-polyprenylbenzoate decarboxylase
MATEKIFLAPIKLTLQPEIEDLHMPDPGVAHNLVIVKIKKSYSGQGMKVINSLLGAGQMMFTKYIVVVDGIIDIRVYPDLVNEIFANTDFKNDLVFIRGPLDVLDHSSDTFAFGGKLGIDATHKTPEEKSGKDTLPESLVFISDTDLKYLVDLKLIKNYNRISLINNTPLLILSVDTLSLEDPISKLKEALNSNPVIGKFKVIIAVDHTVDVNDCFTVAWQVLGNTDPVRDHSYVSGLTLFIDATMKAFRKGGFTRRWPNVVCSAQETIKSVDQKWDKLGLGDLIPSPSLKTIGMIREGNEEVKI